MFPLRFWEQIVGDDKPKCVDDYVTFRALDPEPPRHFPTGTQAKEITREQPDQKTEKLHSVSSSAIKNVQIQIVKKKENVSHTQVPSQPEKPVLRPYTLESCDGASISDSTESDSDLSEEADDIRFGAITPTTTQSESEIEEKGYREDTEKNRGFESTDHSRLSPLLPTDDQPVTRHNEMFNMSQTFCGALRMNNFTFRDRVYYTIDEIHGKTVKESECIGNKDEYNENNTVRSPPDQDNIQNCNVASVIAENEQPEDKLKINLQKPSPKVRKEETNIFVQSPPESSKHDEQKTEVRGVQMRIKKGEAKKDRGGVIMGQRSSAKDLPLPPIPTNDRKNAPSRPKSVPLVRADSGVGDNQSNQRLSVRKVPSFPNLDTLATPSVDSTRVVMRSPNESRHSSRPSSTTESKRLSARDQPLPPIPQDTSTQCSLDTATQVQEQTHVQGPTHPSVTRMTC